MACPNGNPLAEAVVGFFEFLGNPVKTIVREIANTVLAGAIEIFDSLVTNVPTLSSTTTAAQVSDQTQWLVVYLAVGSLLVAAARMALQQRGDAGVTALKGILRVILVAGAATTLATACASLSDRYADHLFQLGAEAQLNGIGCRDGGDIEPFLLLILAFLLLIAGILQTIMLYIRLGVMIVLLGTLPLAAAASMTEWGASWWRKHIGWLTAWLAYKMAVALIIYAGSAMTTAGRETGDPEAIHERIAGIGVMLLSAIALPALLKLVVPATAALGGDPVTSYAVSQGQNALASGARSVGSQLSSPSGAQPAGGAGGAPGPAGAPGGAGAAGAGGA
ncbi:hypothetical protein B1R27_38500, partial [Streptomyces sp. GKU 895]